MRRRRISVLNFKGGTGKSSLTENLSYALAQQGCKVLVIDADRQVNSSKTLLAGQEIRATLKDVIMKVCTIEQAIHQARENLFVIPADTNLDEASIYLSMKRAHYYGLRQQLAQLQYDYVFFDQAGSYTPVMEACLLASNEMFIPCELESYAVQGLFSMFAKLQETLIDHEITNRGIIPYNVDLRYTMHRQYLEELRTEFKELITAPVRTDSLVPKAQSVQLTVLEYELQFGVKSRAAEDFRTLAADLVEEMVSV